MSVPARALAQESVHHFFLFIAMPQACWVTVSRWLGLCASLCGEGDTAHHSSGVYKHLKLPWVSEAKHLKIIYSGSCVTSEEEKQQQLLICLRFRGHLRMNNSR